jgi:hypothetical protein
MKRTLIFLFSFFLIFVMLVSVVFADEEDDFLNALRQKRERDQKAREMFQKVDKFTPREPRKGSGVTLVQILEYVKEAMQVYVAHAVRVTENCMRYDNDTVMLQVMYGRYISAFETCRKQGGGIDECIQRVQRAKEEWRERCPSKDAFVNLKVLYYDITLKAEAYKKFLMDLRGDSPNEEPMVRFFRLKTIQENLAQMMPGTQISLDTGTGTLMTGGGAVHYQGWQFVQWTFQDQGGITVQVFPSRINFVLGSYNIGVYIDPWKEWQLIEFNLPFDAQTEQLLLTFNKGVRLTNREIIPLVNRYLHDTAWEVLLNETFVNLLLKDSERRFFVESLIEYLAYDNYIKKVKAEAVRQKKETQQKKASKKSKQGGL